MTDKVYKVLFLCTANDLGNLSPPELADRPLLAASYDSGPMPVTTFRCEGCGYLESFAKPSP